MKISRLLLILTLPLWSIPFMIAAAWVLLREELRK